MADPIAKLRKIAQQRRRLQQRLSELDAQRTDLIVEARNQRYTLREIAQAADLTFQRVAQITERLDRS